LKPHVSAGLMAPAVAPTRSTRKHNGAVMKNFFLVLMGPRLEQAGKTRPIFLPVVQRLALQQNLPMSWLWVEKAIGFYLRKMS